MPSWPPPYTQEEVRAGLRRLAQKGPSQVELHGPEAKAVGDAKRLGHVVYRSYTSNPEIIRYYCANGCDGTMAIHTKPKFGQEAVKGWIVTLECKAVR